MRALIAGLPEQLLPPPRSADLAGPGEGGVVFAAMGGSAMAAAAASACLRAAGRPAWVVRGYRLPDWALARGLPVVAISYSGNTEETLSAAAAALDAGVPVGAVTSGGALATTMAGSGAPTQPVPAGLPPRAALGYMTAGALALTAPGGAAAGLEEAAEVVAKLLDPGPAPALAADLAAGLEHRVPVVYGGIGIGALGARRWKTQINENAKIPAFWGEIPESNHNEIEGWSGLLRQTRGVFALVTLHDEGDHPRVARRLELVAGAAADAPLAGRVVADGSGTLARFFSLVAVGDLVSVELAERAGVDPVPVDRIETFKRELKGP